VAENVAYAYDAANRVRSITPSGAGGSTRLDAGDAYAWDALSRPTRLERGRAGAAGLDPALAVAYPFYDLGSRPAAEVVGSRDPLAWTWDAFGNPETVRLPSGTGRGATGAFLGFERSYDELDRLTSSAGLGSSGLSPTPLGATWAWGGASRLYAMTTRGALGTGMRLGYHGGAGPEVPGSPAGAESAWKLGRLAWGAAAGSGATAEPAALWGDLGFGWRGHQGLESDGAKAGRAVLPAASGPGVLSGQGWAWGYDGGVRLAAADSGPGNLTGITTPPAPSEEHFTFAYGAGDELLSSVRQSTGETARFATGPYGRITARGGAAFTYDPAGRRLEDDRFAYRWDWRGQLVEVTVKPTWLDSSGGGGDGEADASPYAGHRVSYSYDARGRLLARLHEGEADAGGTRPFIEERRYVWEGQRLAAEAAYGPSDTGENLRWRLTFVPGPTGLDDAPQVVVEVFQPGSPFSGQARTYTYLRDEMGTVLGLVAEDEGSDPQHPPVPVRYRYTPYGLAHAELGPELLRALFDAAATLAATTAGTIAQAIADETTAAPGALVLSWSLPLAPQSFADGLIVERLVAGSGWQAVPAADLAVGTAPAAELGGDGETKLRVMLVAGWAEGTSYRLRLTPALEDRLGRGFAETKTLYWSVPTAGENEPVRPPSYDQRFPTLYESYQAASATAGGRFPGGQSRLFQGLLTDAVTGLSWARSRWLDPRTAEWLSEDSMGAVDSPNLYAFVAWQPTMGTDPMGRQQAKTVGFVERFDPAKVRAEPLIRFPLDFPSAAQFLPCPLNWQERIKQGAYDAWQVMPLCLPDEEWSRLQEIMSKGVDVYCTSYSPDADDPCAWVRPEFFRDRIAFTTLGVWGDLRCGPVGGVLLHEARHLIGKDHDFGQVEGEDGERVRGWMSAIVTCFPELEDILTKELVEGEMGLNSVEPPHRPDKDEQTLLDALRNERQSRNENERRQNQR
jgi:RHS repeat-associated protein